MRRPSGNTEIDAARPATTNEEELQLQLALALSKEEHDEELKRQKADDLKLQMAIEESKKTARLSGSERAQSQVGLTPSILPVNLRPFLRSRDEPCTRPMLLYRR